MLTNGFGEMTPRAEAVSDRRASKRVVAVAESGRSSGLVLESVEKRVGEGNYGVTERVGVIVEHPYYPGGGRYAGSYVRKSFHPWKDHMDNAAETLRKHEYFRTHGFDTWRTVR